MFKRLYDVCFPCCREQPIHPESPPNNPTKENTVKTDPELQQCSNEMLPYFTLDGVQCIAKVVDIYDGDTLTLVFRHNGSLSKFKCRLAGIDCPEMKPPKNKPNREKEIKEAILARNEVLRLTTSLGPNPISSGLTKPDIQRLLSDTHSKVINVACGPFDKYGRLLVDIYDPDTNTHVNQHLIDNGFAVAYDGGTKSEFTYAD